jgi:exonuclease SbcC
VEASGGINVIRSLKLQGWKSHEKTELDFTRGTNVLVGIMGSGKSSVLQAITFGLFGEIPEVRSRKLALSELLMRKPRRLEKAVVELEFDATDVIYKVKRTLTREGSEAHLFCEGSILEVGSRRVTKKVSEILGTDYETFVNVVYARQNEIDNFLRYGKADRVKLIDGLLKIDRLEDARKKLRSFHTGVSRNLVDLKKKATVDTSETKDFIEIVNKKVQELEEELSDIQLAISSTKEKLSVKKLRFAEMDRLRVKRTDLKSWVSRLKGEAKSIKSRLSGLPEIPGASRKLPKVLGELSKLKKHEKELISELSSLKSKREQLAKREAELEKYRDKAKVKVKDYSRQVDGAREKLAFFRGELDRHHKAVAQLESAGPECPVCDSPLKDPKKHIARHKASIAKLEKQIATTEKVLTQLEKKHEESERVRAEVEKAKLMVKELPALEKELKAITVDSVEEGLSEAQEKLKGQETHVEELKKAAEREEGSQRLKELEKELKSYEGELERLGFDEVSYASLRGEVQELMAAFSSSTMRMRSIPQMIEARQSESAVLRRQLDEVENAKREAEKTGKSLETLAVLVNVIADVQVLVRSRFVELANEILGEIWGQLYPYGDYSSLRIYVETDGRRAGDYILQLMERRGWISVDGVASGGERSIASLALRVAFAKALSRLDLLLLDEPTHNLDDNGVEKLSEVLRDGMPAVLEQVLIITHEERMEKASTGSVYRLVRDKETEEPTRVERL